MLNDCDNCAERIGPLGCAAHGSPEPTQPCDTAYHYLGSSPREFPNASRGEPLALCGICMRALRGHRGEELIAREGW